MAVSEQDQGLDELCQRPAVLPSLQQGLEGKEQIPEWWSGDFLAPTQRPRCPTHLYVFLGDEPGAMCQQLVDLIELAQLLRCSVEAQQPLGVPTSLQKLSHVGSHQVGTLVAGGSLWGKIQVSISSFSACTPVGTPIGLTEMQNLIPALS